MLVLRHNIRAFLGRLKTALQARDLTLLGITTDGSALYPEPLAEVFSGVPHQLCQFHVVKEITKEVLKAVAKVRERLAQSKPKLKRGRPSSKDQAARRAARKSKVVSKDQLRSKSKSVSCSRIGSCLSSVV